jgi:hypothetical protein
VDPKEIEVIIIEDGMVFTRGCGMGKKGNVNQRGQTFSCMRSYFWKVSIQCDNHN